MATYLKASIQDFVRDLTNEQVLFMMCEIGCERLHFLQRLEEEAGKRLKGLTNEQIAEAAKASKSKYFRQIASPYTLEAPANDQ